MREQGQRRHDRGPFREAVYKSFLIPHGRDRTSDRLSLFSGRNEGPPCAGALAAVCSASFASGSQRFASRRNLAFVTASADLAARPTELRASCRSCSERALMENADCAAGTAFAGGGPGKVRPDRPQSAHWNNANTPSRLQLCWGKLIWTFWPEARFRVASAQP